MRDFAKFIALKMLQAYKWTLSPMFPPACRYVPTCSEYAIEAVDRYGALRGTMMALARLFRCHPFARGGYDPVLALSVKKSLPQTEIQTAPTNAETPLYRDRSLRTT